MKIFYKFIFIYFIISLITYVNSKPLIFNGLDRLTLNDISKLTNIDISKNDFNESEINILINDLYSSDLISDISIDYNSDTFELFILENKIINKIYFNKNIILKDDELSNIISLKNNTFINNYKLTNDITKIKNIYLSRGYNEIFITVKTEKFSDNKVNVIFDINEGAPSKVNNINFYGNNFFSERFLLDSIKLKKLNFYNIFSSGSNFDESIFNHDKAKIINLYKDYGFFNVDVNYELVKSNLSNIYKINYYINENQRTIIDEIDFNFDDSDNDFIEKIKSKFLKSFSKNDYYYNSFLINNFLSDISEYYKSNNLNKYLDVSLSNFDEKSYLIFNELSIKPSTIGSIQINGNSITKDSTIRSKLSFEPGDYLNDYDLITSRKRLNNLKYINESSIQKIDNNNITDLIIDINENKKTGNILLAGSISGDTGLGLALGIKDNNLFGSGNEIDATINLNSEKALFKISYYQYHLHNPYLKNIYSIYNQENDFTNSFGFKSQEQGLDYLLSYSYNKNLTVNSGISFKSFRGHSGSSSKTYITDNIGNYNQYFYL